MRRATAVYLSGELDEWPKPGTSDLKEACRTRYANGCAGLSAVLSGELGLTRAAEDNQLCRKRLKAMILRAPKIAPDGQPYGFRVCVPWGAYHRADSDEVEPEMPVAAGPHAMSALLASQPTIREWVESYSRPLPPGRPPKTFDRLHAKVVSELTRLDQGDKYPLNQNDKGRRALLRYIRQRRIDTAPYAGVDDPPEVETTLSRILRGRLFDRAEIDAHRIDIEAVLGVAMPNGGVVKRPISTIWLLCEIEAESRAILAWSLRVGRGYNNLDLSTCVSKSLQPWARRDLTIPGLAYVHGAGMPNALPGELGGRRARSVALDNAKAHHATEFEQGFIRSHGGILSYGKPRQPRSRPIVEQLFSRLEQGAFRLLPGGFEPATRLGENKIRISNFSPDDFPIQLHLFEELLDVIIANYNASEHPALGNLSPLQFVQMQSPRAFDFNCNSGESDAAELGSLLVPLKVQGNRKEGIVPHVNYMYVRYRSPDLDGKWELVGKTVFARVCRHDLRTLLLMHSATRLIGLVRAASPWNITRHDETTRALIKQWARQPDGLKLAGVECAVEAYVGFLKTLAPTTPKAVDQLARMQQLQPNFQSPTAKKLMQTPVQVPRRGWVSLDDSRDH